MPAIKMSPDYSFLVQTRDNSDELRRSIESICREAPANSEIIVVDGSGPPLGENHVSSLIGNTNIGLTYTVDERRGVYNAMNVGIQHSRGQWLIIVTAGDTLETGARALLESIRDSEYEVVVFAQNVIDQDGRLSYQCFPTLGSIWPHQSVVVRQRVHENLGLYPLSYRFVNEQFLFVDFRAGAKVTFRDDVLSAFRLGGISSGASLSYSRDLFALRRKLGQGYFKATIYSYLFPYIRYVLERNRHLRGVVRVLRRLAYPEYKGIP